MDSLKIGIIIGLCVLTTVIVSWMMRPDPCPYHHAMVEVGVQVTLLSHPKYKGLIGTPMTVQVVEPPFVVICWQGTFDDPNIQILDMRESKFMLISNSYFDAANGNNCIIWR